MALLSNIAVKFDINASGFENCNLKFPLLSIDLTLARRLASAMIFLSAFGKKA
jgi:hypothetical protein